MQDRLIQQCVSHGRGMLPTELHSLEGCVLASETASCELCIFQLGRQAPGVGAGLSKGTGLLLWRVAEGSQEIGTRVLCCPCRVCHSYAGLVLSEFPRASEVEHI